MSFVPKTNVDAHNVRKYTTQILRGFCAAQEIAYMTHSGIVNISFYNIIVHVIEHYILEFLILFNLKMLCQRHFLKLSK